MHEVVEGSHDWQTGIFKHFLHFSRFLKERMPCIGLCVDHGTEPGLVHFCDFLAFPLQLCLRTFVCN